LAKKIKGTKATPKKIKGTKATPKKNNNNKPREGRYLVQ
jgi:hypothetical protein